MHSCTLSLTSALDVGGWSTPRPGHIIPGNSPLPIVAEVGWAPQTAWTGEEYLTVTGIRSPDHLPRIETLCRLSYPGPGHVRRGERRLATAVCGDNSSALVTSDRFYWTDSRLWELSRSISVRSVE